MLSSKYTLELENHFLDTTLYGYDLDVSIFIYLVKDIWSTLQGDSYIKTLYETFKIDKFVIIQLHRYSRLIDLVFRSLHHIAKYEGYIPRPKYKKASDIQSKDSINIDNRSKSKSQYTKGSTKTSNLKPNSSSDTVDSSIDKQSYFLEITNQIQLETKILFQKNCKACLQSLGNCHNCNQSVFHLESTMNGTINTNSDPTITTPPIPCRAGNVNLYNQHCYFITSNKNSNSSKIEDISSVVNLSNKHLTPPELTILEKGLKFCPTPGEPDISEQHNDLEKFHLRLKRYLHFYKAPADNSMDDDTIITPSSLDPRDPFEHQKFKNPSSWVPPLVSNLEHFITKNHLDLSDTKIPKNKFNNISKDERTAIKNLSTDKSIVIKQADKGGAVVVMNRNDYIKEGKRQLSDNKFYIQTENDLTEDHYKSIETKVNDMHIKGEIDISCYDYLTHKPVRTAQFYMLPKIHKNKEIPPGRPIVSGNGCPTERISQFVDYFLQPGVKKIRSYIQDTTHFLRILQELDTLPANTYLVTMDVSSLYTNIPNIEGIEACNILLNRERPLAKHPTNSSLIDLLTQVLTMNNFDFDEQHYLQIGGTAMGTRVAPCYANTFMGWYEDTHVYQYHTLPRLWKRYIDDIFVIWTHSHQQLEEFIGHLNQCMPSIKFETESSQEKVNFLDVTVTLCPGGHITTDLYTKPTDSHNYLDYQSAHPKHCRVGIPFSQFLRLKRICSETDTFTERCREMSKHFIRANYPPNVIKEAFNKVYPIARRELLLPKEQAEPNPQDPNKSFLITTFHPFFKECGQIVTRNWDLLDRSSATRPLMNLRVIRGNRRAKNLRDLLVRARLPIQAPTSGPNQLRPPSTANIRGTRPPTRCTRHPCRYCRVINRTGTITSNVTGKQYNTRSNVTCRSNNVIYCLSCRTCGKQYVGQTKRQLVERLCEHFRSINNHASNHIVGRHFNSQNHLGLASLEVHILCFIRANPNRPESRQVRLDSEIKWIHRLRSFVPKGLNLMDNNTYI